MDTTAAATVNDVSEMGSKAQSDSPTKAVFEQPTVGGCRQPDLTGQTRSRGSRRG